MPTVAPRSLPLLDGRGQLAPGGSTPNGAALFLEKVRQHPSWSQGLPLVCAGLKDRPPGGGVAGSSMGPSWGLGAGQKCRLDQAGIHVPTGWLWVLIVLG